MKNLYIIYICCLIASIRIYFFNMIHHFFQLDPLQFSVGSTWISHEPSHWIIHILLRNRKFRFSSSVSVYESCLNCDLGEKKKSGKWLGTKQEKVFSLEKVALISDSMTQASSMTVVPGSGVSDFVPTGSPLHGKLYTTSPLNCTRWVVPIVGKFTFLLRWGWLSHSALLSSTLKSHSVTLANTLFGRSLLLSSSSSIA